MTRLKHFDTLFLLQCHQCLIGSTLVDHESEKGDKAKTEVHNLDSSLMGPVFDRLVYSNMILLWKERSALSKHLGSEGLDQRYNVNLIIRRILSRIILL